MLGIMLSPPNTLFAAIRLQKYATNFKAIFFYKNNLETVQNFLSLCIYIRYELLVLKRNKWNFYGKHVYNSKRISALRATKKQMVPNFSP
jgi:hypothetical protein